MREAVIVSTARTPIGKAFRGAFNNTHGATLAGHAIEQVVAGTWKPEFKPFGLAMGPKSSDMVICKATPEQKAKLEQIKKDLLSGKIKVLDA